MNEKKKYYTINEPDELVKFINNNLSPKELEKNENGEVFTPLSLVNEMLDKLDEGYNKEHNKSIFADSSLKWFDPAVGIGNFPVVVYLRLMDGLKPVIKNDEKRRKHILENMLYMSELTPKNVFICKKIFCSNTYKLNINEGDSLKLDAKKKWGIEKFDIVMGNPPYNSGGIKHKGVKNLYVFFATRGFEMLKKDGYLVYIHPPTYRVSDHKIQQTGIDLNDIYTKKQITCIRMFSIEQTMKLMQVMMNVDYIIIKNTENDGLCLTKIIDTKQREYDYKILPNQFIPNYGLNILSKLNALVRSKGSTPLVSMSELHAQFINGNSHKNIHGIVSKGIKIIMSGKPHSLHSKRKLIINGIGSHNYVLYDKNGDYGFTQSPMVILEPSPNTLQLVNSSLFHYIAGATKIIGNNFNKKTSLFLPLIDDKIKISCTSELYSYLKLSKTEIAEIEKTSIPKYDTKELGEKDYIKQNKTVKNGGSSSNKSRKTTRKRKTKKRNINNQSVQTNPS